MDNKAFSSLEAHFAHLGCFLKDRRAGTASPATSSPPACHTSSSILFYSTFPPLGPCPGLVQIFLPTHSFLQDVLPVSNALVHCLKVLPKSVLDNSQFVTQDDCPSKEKNIAGGLWDKGHSSAWGSPLSQGFISPLTPLSQAKVGLEKPKGCVPGPPRVTNPFTTSFQPKHGLSHFISRDILPCKSSPSSPDPQGIHTYTRFLSGITTRARVRHFTAAGWRRQQCGPGTPVSLPPCWPMQHSARAPGSPHRSQCIWRPHSLAPCTPQKWNPPHEQGLGWGTEGAWARGAAAARSPWWASGGKP